MIESHFAKSTEDFYDWLRLFKEIDPNTRVSYIEFENGLGIRPSDLSCYYAGDGGRTTTFEAIKA